MNKLIRLCREAKNNINLITYMMEDDTINIKDINDALIGAESKLNDIEEEIKKIREQEE